MSPQFVQQLHDEMRLAIGRPARDGGADPRRDRGIEKVDVQTDMQKPVAAAHPVDDAADRDRETVFVQPAHVDHVDAAVLQKPPLARVDRPDAEEMQPAGIDKPVRLVAEHRLEAGLAAQHRERHAVHVARRRSQRRVEVRMGVEPEDEQLAPRLGRVAGDAADRPHRQAVIAAEHDRRPPRARDRVGLARQEPRPGRDLGERVGLAFRRGRANGRRRGEIAPVLDVVPQIPEQSYDARDAKHGRPHRRAGNPRARFDRRAEDGDRLPGRLARLPSRPVPRLVFRLKISSFARPKRPGSRRLRRWAVNGSEPPRRAPGRAAARL